MILAWSLLSDSSQCLSMIATSSFTVSKVLSFSLAHCMRTPYKVIYPLNNKISKNI
nr:MAG TPA: hypothetical protein [Caudoviricetes sp.]